MNVGPCAICHGEIGAQEFKNWRDGCYGSGDVAFALT